MQVQAHLAAVSSSYGTGNIIDAAAYAPLHRSRSYLVLNLQAKTAQCRISHQPPALLSKVTQPRRLQLCFRIRTLLLQSSGFSSNKVSSVSYASRHHLKPISSEACCNQAVRTAGALDYLHNPSATAQLKSNRYPIAPYPRCAVV